MSFVTLNGTAIRTRANATDQKDAEHGIDRARMFDGTVRMTRRGIFREWSVVTGHLTTTERDTARALINTNAGLLTLGGDIVDGVDTPVMPVPGSWTPVQTASGQRWQGKFTLMETLGALPPDTSAVPWLFARRGVGLWTTGDMDVAAGTGDLVYVWEDQSGNGRHLVADAHDFGGDIRPIRDGNQIHFGVGGMTEDGGTGLRVDVLDESSPMVLLDEVDLMIGIRAALSPPATSARSVAIAMESSGNSDLGTRYPDTDGHIWETFGFERKLDVGATAEDLTSLHVYNVCASNVTNTLTVRLDNVVIFTYTLGGSEAFGWSQVAPFFGLDSNGGASWEGWMRDILLVNGIMTDTQRRSWYDYMSGAVDDPPLLDP